jgi:hypothetical protein
MTAQFPRFLTIEEAAQRLGVSVARISMWIGECKLPVAARSEYAGFLLRTLTVETVGCDLAGALPPEARSAPLVQALQPTSRTRGRSAVPAVTASVEPKHQRGAHMT